MSKRIGARHKYALQYTALFGLLLLLAYFTRGQWEEFQNVKKIRPATLLWLSLYFLASQLLAGLVLRQFTAAFNVALTFREWFGLVCIRSLGNYLPLSSGFTANAAYLKLRRDLPLTKFASLTAANIVLTALAAALIAVIILLVRHPTLDYAHLPLVLFFSVVGVAGLALILTPMPKIAKRNRFLSLLRSTQEGWTVIRSQPMLLGSVIVLQMAILALIALQLHVVFLDLEYDVDLPAAMLLSVSTSIFRFASLLPGNIGIHESIAGAVAHTLGYPFSAGLIASAIGRVVSMVWVFSLGSVFALVLIRSGPVDERSATGRA